MSMNNVSGGAEYFHWVCPLMDKDNKTLEEFLNGIEVSSQCPGVGLVVATCHPDDSSSERPLACDSEPWTEHLSWLERSTL